MPDTVETVAAGGASTVMAIEVRDGTPFPLAVRRAGTTKPVAVAKTAERTTKSRATFIVDQRQ